ncbi:pyridine nucleotide-disulphide oxidoreductase family protein [Brevibacillus laterosporus GI-9]|uniref:CoA-disulfide reductase n=1 Tax=Brevibacillus laterosporus TaxID=1465 RepID=UPI000240507B|nr:CoA-disulfide reductase [Brevibacillus laterosporus]CCF15244.1 pyridine nucleotide-disulphide oxidoreductase family protein [Brevibacillus laterosporus GI-9]
MKKKIIIVGGVAGGATAAARLRRLSERHELIMVERGEHISYANCGLPYYIGGVIEQRSKLFLQTVEGMSQRFNMDIRIRSEVTHINREKKTVTIHNLQTKEIYEESYDILILSPGAKPIRPAIPGIDEAKQLFTLRSVPDTDAIKSYVDQQQPTRAVVIGGGFIGVEMAENLSERGLDVTLVEMGKQVMAPLDIEMAAVVHEHMRAKGITLLLQDGVEAFGDQGRIVRLSSGRELVTDMIILAIGVQPETQLAKEAGLSVGVRGAIRVNKHMQTDDPAIYAIGDAVEVTDYINKQPTHIPLAWPANRQGRLVADHINGNDVQYNGTLGTSIAKVFDLTVATTGNNEKTLLRAGIEYTAIHVHPASHAGYYPGGAPIWMKLVFDKTTGKLYGAQAISADGADKRIDVIATAIKGGLTIYDLPDLELAYAPPYSSAKDPVNMIGYVASNIADGLVDIVQWHEIDQIVADGGLLVDVREPIERETGYIKGSINIPLPELRNRLAELPKDQTIYVSCQVGLRGYLAARLLSEYGYQVKNVDGGYKTYRMGKSTEETTEPRKEDVAPAAQSQSKRTDISASNIDSPAITIDACGLQCPGPIMQVFQAVSGAQDGQIIEVKATDPGFMADIAAWCNKTGNTLLSSEYSNKVAHVFIQKGTNMPTSIAEAAMQKANTEKQMDKTGATMVVFSGDLDKAMASFIIASGAASMGKKVTMFFTFWGLNILRREHAPEVEKDTLEKMFGMMMPKGANKLTLSKLNMAGMGTKMMQHVMEKKNVDSLETLMKNAQAAGVKLVACAMSMDIMGIKQEELIDGVDVAGVASYLSDAQESGLNLFI